MHLAYIWIVSHLSAKNYRNWWKFDEVLTKTNLLSFFGTRCISSKSNYTDAVMTSYRFFQDGVANLIPVACLVRTLV